MIIFGGLSLLLSGCLPLSVYYREGAQVSRIDSDRSTCALFALRQVPVRKLTRYIPPTYSYKQSCNASGACTTIPVLISPGRWETYDANEGLRAKVAEQCMVEQGYQKVRIKPCPPAVIENTTIRATQVQPPLTTASCAIRIKGDKYQIVTP
ncbi:MAG: hypothetical protein AAFW87_00370 [Pseudomonadota bacterium]